MSSSNKIRRNIIIVGLFAFLMTILTVVETYALFETNGEASTDMSIGKWKILLNDADVVTARTISIDDFVYENGEHTDSNYFAPGSSAYFDLVIDATDCDVSVSYNLNINDSVIDEYPNIYFSVTDMSTNETVIENNYSGVISIDEENKVRTLRITLTWDNDSLYDESDTSLIGKRLTFEINSRFEQYIGE